MVDLYYSQALYQYGFAVGAALAGSGGPARTRFADPDGSLVRYNFDSSHVAVQFRARTVPKITQIISCAEPFWPCIWTNFGGKTRRKNSDIFLNVSFL